MKNWQEDHLQVLLTIKDENELFNQIARFGQQLGFEYCAYGLRMPVPLTRPATLMYNNYPDAWKNKYVQEGYLAVDPTVKHGLRSHMPLVWSDEVFAGARNLWEDARAHGLRVGWAQANRDAQGIGGMLSVARSAEILTRKELEDKNYKLSWLVQIAHQGMVQCVADRLLPEAQAKLSSREIEVLRWTAEGKTSSEVAQLINISERTVNFHISNAMNKLGAANKTSAAIRAAMLGLLF